MLRVWCEECFASDKKNLLMTHYTSPKDECTYEDMKVKATAVNPKKQDGVTCAENDDTGAAKLIHETVLPDTIYNCVICIFKTFDLDSFVHHLKSHLGQQYNNSDCEEGFRDTANTRPFSDLLSQRNFSRVNSEENFYNSLNKMYICGVCNFSNDDIFIFKQHKCKKLEVKINAEYKRSVDVSDTDVPKSASYFLKCKSCTQCFQDKVAYVSHFEEHSMRKEVNPSIVRVNKESSQMRKDKIISVEDDLLLTANVSHHKSLERGCKKTPDKIGEEIPEASNSGVHSYLLENGSFRENIQFGGNEDVSSTNGNMNNIPNSLKDSRKIALVDLSESNNTRNSETIKPNPLDSEVLVSVSSEITRCKTAYSSLKVNEKYQDALENFSTLEENLDFGRPLIIKGTENKKNEVSDGKNKNPFTLWDYLGSKKHWTHLNKSEKMLTNNFSFDRSNDVAEEFLSHLVDQNEIISPQQAESDQSPFIIFGDKMLINASNMGDISFKKTYEGDNNDLKYSANIGSVGSVPGNENISSHKVKAVLNLQSRGKLLPSNRLKRTDFSTTLNSLLNIYKPHNEMEKKVTSRHHSKCLQENYICHICNQQFSTHSNLKRHMLKHEKCLDGPVKCELCSEELNDAIHLKQHVIIQHQKYIKCALCEKKFVNKKLCREHELTHPERTTYKCDCCNQKFITEGRLKNHKELIHGDTSDSHRENSIFKCHMCFKTLTTLHNLKRHLANHEKHTKSISCNICLEVFADKILLQKHMEQIHSEKYHCKFCSKVFSSLRSRKIHETSHPERLIYKCDVCENIFLTELRLKRHMEMTHREPFCRICSKQIIDRTKLIEHEKRHERHKRKFACQQCPKLFQTASGLKYHTSVHTGKYAVYCEICGKGLHSEVVLEEHKATHTKEVRYTCERCGRTFSSNSTYRLHRLWHDNPLPYQCSLCGRKFKHTSLLSVHKRRAHTGERPYKCKFCPMTFSVCSTHNKHLILHTKQYPYKCEQCNKGFTTRTKVAKHLAKVHNDNSMLSVCKKVCEYKMVLRPNEMPETTVCPQGEEFLQEIALHTQEMFKEMPDSTMDEDKM